MNFLRIHAFYKSVKISKKDYFLIIKQKRRENKKKWCRKLRNQKRERPINFSLWLIIRLTALQIISIITYVIQKIGSLQRILIHIDYIMSIKLIYCDCDLDCDFTARSYRIYFSP